MASGNPPLCGDLLPPVCVPHRVFSCASSFGRPVASARRPGCRGQPPRWLPAAAKRDSPRVGRPRRCWQVFAPSRREFAQEARSATPLEWEGRGPREQSKECRQREACKKQRGGMENEAPGSLCYQSRERPWVGRWQVLDVLANGQVSMAGNHVLAPMRLRDNIYIEVISF